MHTKRKTVHPKSITGTHNEVDDDNNPVYQGIDQSKLVPLYQLLSLQEAMAKIETLEDKVAALEGWLIICPASRGLLFYKHFYQFKCLLLLPGPVSTLDRTVADGIVGTVHYTVSAADDTYSSGAYGSVGLEAPAEGDTVIPYADLG